MEKLALILLALIPDVVINWYIIEVKKIDSKLIHRINWLIRAVIGIIIAYQESILVWFYTSIATCFLYMFLFDTALNKARKKPLIHLGDHFLDAFQKKYIGEFPSFVWKCIIAIFCICLFLYKFDITAIYSY